MEQAYATKIDGKPMAKRVVFLNGRDAGTALNLPDKGTVRFGRSRGNQITIRDRNASRVHCQMLISSGGVTLTDMNSANGTLVNGERVSQRDLSDRDMITIGFTRLRYEESANGAEPPTKGKVAKLLCIQCGSPISEEDIDAGVARQVGSVTYCGECSRKMVEDDFGDDATTITATRSTYGEGDYAGPYRLMHRVGKGYRGSYWLVGRDDSEQKFGFKLYGEDAFSDIDWALQYMREMKRTSRFSHPNVIHVFDAGLFDDRFGVAMEFVKGRSLKELLDAKRRMTANASIRIAVDILKALSFLEEHHYNHGDIQPAAVMVIRTGAAKLGDFGLRVTLPALGPAARFKAGRGIEAMRYYAPEQFDASATLDNRSDLYGVGALLYHMICRRPPFGGGSAKEVVTNIRNVMPIPAGLISPGLPAAINSIIARAISKDPEERYQTAGDFMDDLEAVLAVPNS